MLYNISINGPGVEFQCVIESAEDFEAVDLLIAKIRESFARPTEEKARAILHHVTYHSASKWHDGNGWYYVSEDYPEEGSVGAFSTREEAVAHAEAGEYFFDPIPTETTADVTKGE